LLDAGPLAASPVWMISMPLTSGFSTEWAKSMLTVPSLVTVNSRIVPV